MEKKKEKAKKPDSKPLELNPESKATSHPVSAPNEQEGRLSGDGPVQVKRTNTYVINMDDNSPILDIMEKQEIETMQEFEQASPNKVFDEKSSSEDDEEFIRRSLISNQKRFSSLNIGQTTEYMTNSSLPKINEEQDDPEHQRTITLGSDEKPNGLAKLCDKLISLNDLVTDKNDRIFT